MNETTPRKPEPPCFCIVATFDNCDPQVFGPYETLAGAEADVAKVWDRHGDHHTESVTARLMGAV